MSEISEALRLKNMENCGFGVRAMQQIKVCAGCGVMSASAEQFCRECGRRLPSETLYQFYRKSHPGCSRCSTVLSDEAVYCPQCGSPVKPRGQPDDGGQCEQKKKKKKTEGENGFF